MSAILMISAVAMAVMLMLTLPVRREPASSSARQTPADHAARLLADRYARGEISAYDYHRVREVLYS